MYHTVDQKICKELRIKCEEILKGVQDYISEYFTFQFYLIGSGERKLVTQNDNGYFDLDYNLVLMKDKKGLINNPKRIKDIFLDAFNKLNPDLGFSFAQNSTSVITSKLISKINNEKIKFSFDCAIMCEGNSGSMYKIAFVKPDRYLWNEIKDTKDFNAKYSFLVQNGRFKEIKDRYVYMKNLYLENGIKKSSYSILNEVVNDLLKPKK